MRALTDKRSYLPGEQINIRYEFGEGELPFSNISNISTDILRADIARNDLMIAFGKSPIKIGATVTVSIDIPASAKAGICFISSAIFIGPNAEDDPGEMQKVHFEPVFFDIRPHFLANDTSQEALVEAIKRLEEQREEFTNQPHTTELARDGVAPVAEFSVLIFAVGCLVHARQQLEGYSISSTGLGLSHKRFLEIMNAELAIEGLEPLPYQAELEDEFARGTPTVTIKYARVKAVSHDNAFEYCRAHARQIFELLGRNQGQIPREFGGVALEIDSMNWWQFFEMPGYRGNLVSDFSPADFARSIERSLPILEANPFARLLNRVFAEATGETELGYRFLRYWTVLELVADREITKDGTALEHPDGTPILNFKGKPETTHSKHGRVYQYILQNGGFTTIHSYQDKGATRTIITGGDESNPNFKPGVEVFSLWQMVRSAYAVRCSVAHEGHFDVATALTGDQYEQLAARLLQPPYSVLHGFLEQVAKLTVNREA